MSGTSGVADSLARTAKIPDIVPLGQRDAFLRLPVASRDVAVERLTALVEFAQAQSGKTALAIKLAKRLQISRSRFYQLAKAWDETGSVDNLVPYASAKVSKRERNSRIDDERLSLLRNTIGGELQKNPICSKTEVFRAVERNFLRRNMPVPAFSTVGRAYDAFIETSHRHSSVRRLKRLREPEEYGSALAIDYADIFISADHCLTLTVVIDAFTSTIAGLSLGYGAPDMRSAAWALLSALRKPLIPPSPLFLQHTFNQSEQLVVMNVNKDRGWRKLDLVLEKIVGGIDVRAYESMVSGTFAFSLIGRRLGHYDLRYRRMNRPGIEEVSWKPIEDQSIVRSVEAAAREHNRMKLSTVAPLGERAVLPPGLFGERGHEVQEYLEDLLAQS